jgi:hypothetical protein
VHLHCPHCTCTVHIAAALWEEQNRTGIDDSPLSKRWRRNIARMLEIAAWHERQLCLVAVEDGRGVDVIDNLVCIEDDEA